MHKMGDNSQMRVFLLKVWFKVQRDIYREKSFVEKNGHNIEGGYKEKS